MDFRQGLTAVFPFPGGKVILLVHTYPGQTFASIPIRAYHNDLKG
jgi:hypothetical protein